jgi:dTMP kinase
MPLIVLEGLDGAGKSTQLALLAEHAARAGHATEFLHFPRFDTPFYGETIARFLRGDFGEELDPYTIAHLFAGDRAEAAPMLREWLAGGRWVVLDRYVYSNVAYQCAKVEDAAARRRLKEWILQLEYGIYAIPRPDVSLFLDVPFRFTEARLAAARQGSDRDYLQGGRDIHESSLELQRRVREVYLEAAAEDPALKIIDCGGGTGDRNENGNGGGEGGGREIGEIDGKGRCGERGERGGREENGSGNGGRNESGNGGRGESGVSESNGGKREGRMLPPNAIFDKIIFSLEGIL